MLLLCEHDGSWCFYIDYKALSKVTVKDKFPISVIEELIDEFQRASAFSKLDLRLWYHQVPMHPNDVEKITFKTYDGHYEFLVMPFRS